MGIQWLSCEVFDVYGCVSVRWFLLDWGLDIMSVQKNKLSEISVSCKGNSINVSRYKFSEMISGNYLVQHLFPLAQMKIGLVCRKLSLSPTMGQPLQYSFTVITIEQQCLSSHKSYTFVLLLHQPPSL